MRILVTGGSGFIGSALVKELIQDGHEVRNFDLLTYAANPQALKSVEDSPRYSFSHGDISDSEKVQQVLRSFIPDRIFHLAAESHVDRSISSPERFIQTNILGTSVLLRECLAAIKELVFSKAFRFIQVSTDEVYGSLGPEDSAFVEDSPFKANSPYAASKAAADLLARSYFKTYNFPWITTHACNTYGAFQNAEKLLPRIIYACLGEEQIPIYGDGENIREWMHTEDHVQALISVGEFGELGQTYNIGSGQEISNLSLATKVCSILDERRPRKNRDSYTKLIKFVSDRPGHDFRYALNSSKISMAVGWQARRTLEQGLLETCDWFLGQKP
jgi:dTDP-glucose 4,6-dehydratase